MPATPVKIGPFAGGLNTYSGPTSVGDNECVDLVNFDIDLDGSLYSRTPITVKDPMAGLPATATTELLPLGWFIDTTGERYLFVASGTSTFTRRESDGVWAVATNTFAATCSVQYAGKMYLIASPASANPGGTWTPAGGFVAVAAIVKGTSCSIYKERLFIGGSTTNPNRIFFSNPADFAVWQTSINFFDVRSGDGQSVVLVYTFQDSVIVFKNRSTYIFSYDSNPSRGQVRLISGAVGLTNKYCCVEYESALYLHYENTLYQLNNWNFTVVNLKVPFEYSIIYDIATYGTTNYPTLSIMSDRLVIHHYDIVYVFNLRMGVWTKWSVALNRNFNYFLEVPRNTLDEPERYYGGCRAKSVTDPVKALYEWRPVFDTTRTESMTHYVVSKTYDFNVAYTFKRLFWWGADVLAKRDITYSVSPVSYSPSITHAQLHVYKHSEITGNHLRPISISINYTDNSSISNVAGTRLFVKMLKSMRFRQIYFTLTGTTDGTSTQGPLRVFSLTAMVDNKELVAKELS